MPEYSEAEQPRQVLELLDYPEERALREMIMGALLFIPRKTRFRVSAEANGVMRSIGLYDGEDWCFSIAPAKHWVKVWI